MQKYDLVVVGAGLAGSVVAENSARRFNWRVAVVEQRDHVAGNTSDTKDEHGVLVHRYGPHVFHTNCETVWAYLSRFTKWRPYRHRVMSKVHGQLVPLPINLQSIDTLFPKRGALLCRSLVAQYGMDAEVPILRLRQSEDRNIRELADEIYQAVYVGYTTKQWGLTPEELEPSVSARVPVRIGLSCNYFSDRYEAIPVDGYTAMVERVLSHPRIETFVGVEYHSHADAFPAKRVLYTGGIDRFFEFKFGPLPYRTLDFEFRHADRSLVQQTAAITYPSDGKYTRSCEYKHLTGQRVRGTTLSFEIPGPHVPGKTLPYYPIPLRTSREKYKQYAQAAARIRNVVFCGRLGRYQYLNMDQAVAQALHTVDELAALA